MQRLIQQLMQFAVVGVIATVIDYMVFVGLFNLLSMNYLVATVLAFITSTVFNYWASMRFVFESRYTDRVGKIKEFAIFTTLSILGLLLTTGLMYLTVSQLNIHPNIAKILVTGIVMIFNFVTRKLFVEKR